MKIVQANVELVIEIVEENNYYPFGLQHKGYNSAISANGNATAQKFKYNGVEFEKSLGLDLYEMDVRSYDPAIGRFTSIDPVTHHSMSTYTAFDNNPVFWADPSGADSTTDIYGRATRDPFTDLYIAPNDRGAKNQDASNQGENQQTSKTENKEAKSGASSNSTDPPAGSVTVTTDNGFTVTLNRAIIYGKVEINEGLKSDKKAVANFADSSDKLLTYMSPFLVAADQLLQSGVNMWGETVSKSAMIGSKFFGYALSGIGLGINAHQYRRADMTNNTLAKKQAAASAFSNLAILRGGPMGWAIGFGGHLSLMINPSMGVPAPIKLDWENTCFVAGTKIILKDGSTKKIEDIEVGDEILSVNISTMEIESDLVLIVPNKDERYNKIYMEFDNGSINISSPHHPFFVKGKGWSVYDVDLAKKDLTFEISKIELGDVVYFYSKGVLKETKIIKLEDQKEEALMYNIKYVKKNNTFFANGILVHNRYEN